MTPVIQPRFLLLYYFLGAQILGLIVGLAGAAAGIKGFALVPYQNAAFALAVGTLLTLVALNRPENLRIPSGVGALYVMGLVVLIPCGLMLGLMNGNARVYVISTFLYWYNILLFLLLLPSLDVSDELFERIRRALIAISVITILVGGTMSVSTRLLIFIFFAMHIVYEGSFRRAFWVFTPYMLVLQNMNRATLLAVGVVMVLATITARKSVKFLLAMMLVMAVVFMLFFADLSQFFSSSGQLYRRLDEVQKLLVGGSRLEDFVALRQRLLEVELVNEIQARAMGLMQLFGQGFGRTIDMSAISDDTSVLNSALLGATSVHNIHSLLHSVFLRYGYFGVVLLTLLCVNILWNVVRLGLGGQRSMPLLIFVYYPLARVINALPAANNFYIDFIVITMVVAANHMLRRPSGAAEAGHLARA